MNLLVAKEFVAKFVEGDYTPEEYATFLQWLKGATIGELNAIADEHEALHEHWDVAGLVPADGWVAGLEGKLDRQLIQAVEIKPNQEVEKRVEAPVVEITERKVIRRRAWIAAASVVVLMAGGVVFYTYKDDTRIAGINNGGRNKGSELPLMASSVVSPKGGDVKEVVLADGSRVLLNVASELKYPAAFTGAERVVELSGEAYFEVAPDAAKPFRVLIRDAEVDVLGTNFNVRAYPDELVSSTTLMQGAVEMESKGSKAVLKPGEQAEIAYPSTGVSGDVTVSKVDADEVVLWKKGIYKFRNADLMTVMRVLQRYYNVDIQYDHVPDMKVSGLVTRAQGLEQNLKELQSVGGFHFDIKGKTVIVTL